VNWKDEEMLKPERSKDYDIINHVHRFAAWAAGTAASYPFSGFKVRDCMEIIEDAQLCAVLMIGTDALPPDAGCMDVWHRLWREEIIRQSKKHKTKAGKIYSFSH
jgi:hypothetical protein